MTRSAQVGALVGTLLLGMTPLVPSAAGAPAAPSDADALIDRLRDNSLPEVAIDALVIDLARTGAVDVVRRAAMSREFGAFRTAKLARALGRMGTPEALEALRGMLFTSVYLAGDVTDWRALGAKIASGEADAAPPLERAVSAALSRYARGVLKQAAETGRPEDVRARDVARSLNAVLKDRTLFRHLEGSGVQLGGEGDELLARHAAHPEPKPGTALSRIEVERLNRLILDRVFDGAVAPLAGPPIMKFHPHLVRGAHAALGEMETAAARELLLNAEPIGFKDRLKQAELLGAIPGRDACAALGRYLTDDETAISSRARDALVARFADRANEVSRVMDEVLARVKSSSGEGLSDTALADVFAVCVAAPEDAAAARLLARGLAAKSERVVLAALEALARRPALVADTSLLEALERAVERARDVEVRKRALAVIAEARLEDGADVAAMCLSDPDLEVQTLAVKALRRTTDLRLGMSPKAWRDHFASEAAEGAEAGPATAISVTVPDEESSPLALALMIGLPVVAVLAFAGVAIRRRMFRARIDAEIARRGRGR